MKLAFAFCTYNRAPRLEALVSEMRKQRCPIPFEILAVNNNSQDDTLSILERLTRQEGPRFRYVTEERQGIVPARNRAIKESLDKDILVFIDDDELPCEGLLQRAHAQIVEHGAQCVGGKVTLDFSNTHRPAWLGDDLLGFLAEVDYGEHPFVITDDTTPIWTANVAYDISIFRENPDLRFDMRYNREGNVIGGGEDAIMLRTLLERGVKIVYEPGMEVLHRVESWRIKRRYFLYLHYRSGFRYGQYRIQEYPKTLFGAPRFLFGQLLRQAFITLGLLIRCDNTTLRNAMNVTYTWGSILGYRERRKDQSFKHPTGAV